MSKYEITGRTSAFYADRAIGEVIEDDLDKETERQLIDAGVLRKLEDEKKPEPKKAAKTSGAKKSSR